MKPHPDDFSEFYSRENITLDIRLIEIGYRYFRPHFRVGTCLELGPATGYMTRLLVEDFPHVTAVEGAADLLSQIPHFENLTKVHALFEEFTPRTRFNTIMMNHVLEHIEEPIPLLRRIRDWLADDGVLILGVPNAKSFHRLAAVRMGLLETEYSLNERDRELGHFRVYDLNQLREDALEAGYAVEAEGGTFLKFLANSQMESTMNDSMLEAYHELGLDFVENCAEVFLALTTAK
ncbi:MAG: class I SAM-dependent methyltransferase [Verrucomicrobiae bacterium]|nr:class I SAM-dependent methyltransferase [Verrucomicrobiae bacterium]